MKDIYTKTEDGKILVKLKKEFYEKSAVFFAAHKLTDRFVVLIEPFDNLTVSVSIQPKPGINMAEDDLKDAIFNFCNEAVDQQVRLDLEKRYGNIRELIVKQAFAPLARSDLEEEIKKAKS